MTEQKKEAIYSLRCYKLNKKNIINLRERIELLSTKLEGMHSPGNTSCGTYRAKDETYCELIGKIDEAKAKLDALMCEVRLTEKALDALSEEERQLIEGLYIDRCSIRYICDTMHMSQATAYRRTDVALCRFADALCIGISDEKSREKKLRKN